MTTYPIKINTNRFSVSMEANGYEGEMLIKLECTDIKYLFDQLTVDILGNELFEYLKKHHDKDELREALCL